MVISIFSLYEKIEDQEVFECLYLKVSLSFTLTCVSKLVYIKNLSNKKCTNQRKEVNNL